MNQNRKQQYQSYYGSTNEDGPHYAKSASMRGDRNTKARRRLSKRRRRRRNLMIMLLTIVCLVSAAFAFRIPEQIHNVYGMLTDPGRSKAQGSGGNAFGNAGGTGDVGGSGDGGGMGVLEAGKGPEDAGGTGDVGGSGDGGGMGDVGAGKGPEDAGSTGDAGGTGSMDGANIAPTLELVDGKNTDIGSRIDLTRLNSPNAILVALDSGEILAGQNEDKRIYPASLTKIMTALVVLENTQDWEESITMPEEIYSGLYAEDASMAGFQAGETASIKALLYGIILPSGAECCEALALHVAGSKENFIDMMNQKAQELGMENTHFVNTTGLHNENHYTTVKDLAVLLRYALRNDHFREVFTAHRYSTAYTNIHPDGFTFDSTLFRYVESSAVTGGEIIGGKTGYTGEAGLCLASLAAISGREYILITTGADGNHETEQFHITDAFTVFNQLGASVSAG